jgi:hypothetical protein
VTNHIRNELTRILDDALGDDPKRALIAVRQLKDEVEWLTERSVALARREGWDWGRISRLLGITRQWARERFKASGPWPAEAPGSGRRPGRLVKLGVDRFGDGIGQERLGLQFLERRLLDRVDSTHHLHQLLLA